MEKFRKILLCYVVVLAVTGFYADFLSQQKPPYLAIINFTFSILNLTIIGFLLYHWDTIRRWNAAIEDADPAPEPQPEPVFAAG